MSQIKELEHLKRIPFLDIKEATKNFTTNIGEGGYGPVYKGEISLSGNLTSVAVKRLNYDESGQGLKEFLTEIHLLSRYKHQNLISLLGYCEEGPEKMLIYEFAERGSLEKYLNTRNTKCPLTWKQRIKICVDAARGLDYLHNHVAADHRVIHRDIKSANILLDQNWKAMIADLGLSKIGRAIGKDTFLITDAGGTIGYCDPAYINDGILTKESDVYSFGVVLFEALCGRLFFMDVPGQQRLHVPLARQCYELGKLDAIMDLDLKDSESVREFSKIAYQCVHDEQKGRPSMDVVLQKLEKALELLELMEEDVHKLGDILELETDYAAIKAIHMMTSAHPTYTTKDVYRHLSSGILIDEGNVWFRIDENGKNHEMISALKFMPPYSIESEATSWSLEGHPTCVFSRAVKISGASKVNVEVKITPQFLSSNVSYTAYLVCMCIRECDNCKPWRLHGLKYKLNNQRQSYNSYPRYFYEHDWLMIELFQTNSLKRDVEFKVFLEEFHLSSCLDEVIVQGIAFLPIQKFDDEIIKPEEMENLTTCETRWENLLPSDYEQFVCYPGKRIKETKNHVITKTKEEAYTILSTGVSITKGYNDIVWFWITKSNGKKCFMLSPGSVGLTQLERSHPNESRFEYVKEIRWALDLNMAFIFDSSYLSTNTSYACYLVYKATPGFDYPVYVETSREILGLKGYYRRSQKIYHDGQLHLSRSQRPIEIGPDGVVIGSDGDAAEGEGTPKTIINKLPMRELPSKRKDGWLEVTLWKFTTHDDSSIQKVCPEWFTSDVGACTKFPYFHTDYEQRFYINVSCQDHKTISIHIPMLRVQGLEFRPL